MILIVDPRLLLLIPVGVSEPSTDAQVPVTRLYRRDEKMLHVFILARSVHVDLLRSKGQDRAVQLVQGQCQGQDRAVRLVQVQAKIVQFKYKHQQ